MPFDSTPAAEAAEEVLPGDKYVAVRDLLSLLIPCSRCGPGHPMKGEVVTLVFAEPHHVSKCLRMLYFREYPIHGFAERTYRGEWNFRRA